MSKLDDLVKDCIDEIVAIRRDIHRHPERGREEIRTSSLIREKLAQYGVDQIKSPVPTAVVALIHGALGEGKCVALRADIDALPVIEDTGLEFSSEVSGVMHACGHDMHASMLLGVAKVLCSMRDQFRGTVKLIFQHSEDRLPGGAKELVEKGVLENPKVDALYALHVMPHDELMGKIGIRAGAMTTSVDLYTINVVGRGGHGSEPHKTDDPILAACQMIVSMQQIVARRVDPMETAVLSIGSIHSGDAPNVIPDTVRFEGVSRAYSEEVREVVREQMFGIAKGMESISGCNVQIDHSCGYPSLSNDPALVDIAKNAIAKEIGSECIVELPKPMGFSEDLSYYEKDGKTPTVLMMLYSGHEGEKAYPLHSAKCTMKEEALPYGIRTLAATATEFLNQ